VRQYMQKIGSLALSIAALSLLIGYMLHQFGPAINNQINRLGKDQYYVRITDAGRESDTHSRQRQIYQYKLMAYNQQGNIKRLTFTADRQLQSYAWLRLYVTKDDAVTAWEEVSSNGLPT
jgi:uncharacterized protein (TIGR01655 family)